MLQFLKFVLATLVGLFLFFIVSFFILVGIGSALSSDDKVIVESNSVLKLDLDRPIKEVGVENPFSNLSIPFATNEETIGLKDIREAITLASKDDNIKGIYLKTQDPGAGWASLEEIRNALLDYGVERSFGRL